MSCREKKARTWDKDCGAGAVRGLSLRRQKEKTDAKKGGRSMCRCGLGGAFQAERMARVNVLREGTCVVCWRKIGAETWTEKERGRALR